MSSVLSTLGRGRLPGFTLDRASSAVSGASSPRPQRSGSVRLLIFCGSLLAMAVIVATAVISLHLRHRALADTERELQNTALVLAEQADRAFGALELVQASIIERVNRLGLSSPAAFDQELSNERMHKFLKDNINGLPYVETVAIINRQGTIINFSRFWPAPRIDTSDRDFFKSLQSDPELISVLSDPVFNKTTGTWSIYLARKIVTPAGDLLGFILGGLELRYFEELFANLALGPDASISLFRRDGVLFVRHPARIAPGTPYSNSALFRKVMSQGGNGVVRFKAQLDGRERIVAAHNLPHYPARIGVGKSTEAALEDWREQVRYLVGASVLVVLVICGIVLVSIRRLKTHARLAEAEAARATAEAVLREREQADALVRQQKLQLATALNTMPQGLVMFDGNGRVVVCNERYRQMYGLSPEVAKPGICLRALIEDRVGAGLRHGDVDELTRKIMQDVAQRRRINRVINLADGRVIAVSAEPMEGGGWVATHDDITEQRRAEERIAYLAHHSAVTGLPNRAAFLTQIGERVERAKAKGETFALLCFDVDRFKQINDLFGPAYGDEILRQFAARLESCCDGAFVANLGADEFAVIADGPQPAGAETLVARILEKGAEPFEAGGQSLTITLSLGVAMFPADGLTSEALIANATAALDRAKAEGRRGYRFFEPELDRQLREKRILQNDLRRAVELRQLALHYQPLARIDGTVVGFEALARWHHPGHGTISPGIFIPLAEESDLISPIGEWILRDACREAASWSNPLQISVNLSPVQLRDEELIRKVHSILVETGLLPSRLELEITEGALIDDQVRALSVLRQLKALGVRIAMDDFGTGYSSLSYLQSFPFDKMKIDRSFVANLGRNQSGSIVKAIITLGHSLGLPVIAEGVETTDQLRFLEQEACDGVQGFLIGRPLPIDEYASIVNCSDGSRREHAPRPTQRNQQTVSERSGRRQLRNRPH
jgi:diguanylate cyclase (GGDEF)-like protein/PAS domain S-box-containing protein